MQPPASSLHELAIEGEKSVAPGIESQEGIVAAAQNTGGGKKSFDGRKTCGWVDMDLGAARVGGPPAWRNGTSFDRFDGFAHLRGMPPVGIEQEERSGYICCGQRRGLWGKQEITRKVGLLAQGIEEELKSWRSAKWLNRALGSIFTPPDNN